VLYVGGSSPIYKRQIVETDDGHYPPRENDRAFIAATNPQAVLELVERVRYAEERARIAEKAVFDGEWITLSGKALQKLGITCEQYVAQLGPDWTYERVPGVDAAWNFYVPMKMA
jgi:hypothetical protein